MAIISVLFVLIGFMVYLKDDKQRSALLIGYLTALATISLVQDAIGPERYLTYVKEHWVPSYYSVPLALFLILWGMLRVRQLNFTPLQPGTEKEGGKD